MEENAKDAAASEWAALGPSWTRAAAKAYAQVVKEAVGRGWTEEDLARMATRELGEPFHRLAVAMAAAPGRRTLDKFAAEERLDRFSAARAVVDLLGLYSALPPITALTVPPPSTPGEGSGGKALARIRALLAKAESTGFPEEAEALSAKAQQLMARHSIDAAALAAANGAGPDAPAARRIGVDRPYEGAKALLLDAVAAANRCESVWSAEFGFSTVVGHRSDLEAVEVLFTSLLVQADRALHRGRTSRSRDFRESFLISYAARVGERLTAATEAEVAEAARAAGPELLPALAARDLAVRDTTRRLFPRTTATRLKGRDADGWRDGRTAADRARLEGP
ncbi:hypothetical protein RVR_4077 [Actinacidiphila reveromycinica]|uniref:DUF2786 domain-containing protein n=1 Tax=Actinacidiphila reveromycinica TaxID=659352 RepID=A0A7U3VNX8_9ACTN|nr:DUF2786 domain-containing protein [Streptomyces sp. SN-593]BBA98044.1 hypothetical protein RVR_4077 [Streptomyces sp. SN-593]